MELYVMKIEEGKIIKRAEEESKIMGLYSLNRHGLFDYFGKKFLIEDTGNLMRLNEDELISIDLYNNESKMPLVVVNLTGLDIDNLLTGEMISAKKFISRRTDYEYFIDFVKEL